jgi:GTP-binding protein
MAFVDHIEVHIKAGKGGDGVVRWRREKFISKGGPSGGNGGRGGNVYVRGTRAMHTLARYAHQKEFEAGNGSPGENRSKQGKQGDDLTIELPVGAIVKNLETNNSVSLEYEGQEDLILLGGRGGLGNEYFKSSTNTTPKEYTPGMPGEEAEFAVELELFADVGLIGLPNAGKSSLLNIVTNAQAKVGDYPFTTLDPNLGDFYGYIIADIPGLIEGAAEGKGLGHKFLKHVRRTKMLLHLVSVEHGDKIRPVYDGIREELGKFDPALLQKFEVIVLTKTDLISKGKLEEYKKLFPEHSVLDLSHYDDESIKRFGNDLSTILKEKISAPKNETDIEIKS